MSEQNFLFSQAMLSKIADISPSTISRVISKLTFSKLILEKKKKYSFEESRIILREIMNNEHLITEKVQVFFNFKGGTGKTSLCHQISVHMALFGFKVLAIDCDPQAHLTYAFKIDENEEKLTLYDIIVNKINVTDAIRKNIYPGIDLIPSDLSLTRLDLQLNQLINREKILIKITEPLKKEYDFIFLDTNPTISILNQNTTYCADVINIICETQPFSLKGLEMLVRELNIFSNAMEKDIKYKIIPNKYESKTATSQEVLGSLRRDYGEKVMESIVRKCEDINISAKKRLPVSAFCKKNSIAFEDICDLALAILSKSSN